jgi:hypothetical protein
VFLRMLARVLLAMLLAIPPAIATDLWRVIAPAQPASPTIRPEFQARMEALRPEILAAAARHNRPSLSKMSDHEFAVVLAQIMYNEHVGWLEDLVPPVRLATPLYQSTQVSINTLGTDFTVWPSNLRPSVAVEILRGELPVPGGRIHVPVRVSGAGVRPADFADQRALYAAVNGEISQAPLAIEYLAANLERGLYRARYERAPVTWQTLAAWHNRGIVHPDAIQASPEALHYLQRAAAYRGAAERLLSLGR